MAAQPGKELDLSSLRPKGFLRLRLMFEGAWKILTLVGIVFGLGAIVGAAVLYFLIAEEQSYRREGVRAAATVTDKGTYRTRSGDSGSQTTTTHYRVYYTFKDAGGASHAGKGDVERELWDQLQPGGTLEVEYLPSRPSRNRPTGSGMGGFVWLFVLIPAIAGTVGVVMLVIVGRRAARNARLLTQGTLTRGVVEEKAEETSITINDRHPFRIAYTFALPDGEVRTGKDLVADLAFAAKLAPGAPVGVVYLPADPARSALFHDRWMKYFHRAHS